MIVLNIIFALQAVAVVVVTPPLKAGLLVERIAVHVRYTYRMMLLLAAVTLTYMVQEKQQGRHVRAGDWDFAAKNNSQDIHYVRMGG